MSSKVKLVNTETQQSPHIVQTDWSKCILCQEETSEKLRCPASSKQNRLGAGYINLAEDLTLFNDNACLPKSIDISRLNYGNGIEETLRNNSAKFHTTCRLLYSKSRLQRAIKRKRPNDDSDNEELQSTCHRHPRQKTNTLVCLFCEKPGSPTEPLHEAMMDRVTHRVKQCAIKLLDERLIAKVSSGDLVASEAKYHAKCLVALYNAAERKKTTDSTNTSEDVDKQNHYARAFAELLSFIDDSITENHDQNTSPVFRLSDLRKLYSDRLLQLGVSCPYVHSTRLKDRILANFPELKAFKEGRDILLISNDDIGVALRKACESDADDDALTLSRAARIVRKDIMNSQIKFNGSFLPNCQAEAIPHSLATLVAMLLYGPNITEQAVARQNQAFLSISQLLLFNSKKPQKNIQITRHDKSREPPLPVYIGILIHNKTRKRDLVEKMYELGLSVSYDRVLEISTEAGTSICRRYEQLDAVCPPQLKKHVFTTAAVDNINHQTSSTTAKNSFNGTGISIFQHCENLSNNTVSERIEVENTLDNEAAVNNSTKRLPRLPVSYTQVPPVAEGRLSSTIPQVDGPITSSGLLVSPALQQEYRHVGW